MLVVVYFVDPRAHRWFQIKGVGSFQPSEFAKPALILFLAYFVSRAVAGDQRPPDAAAGADRGGDARVHGGGGGSGNGAGAGDHGGDRLLGGRPGAALHAARRADGRRRWWSSRYFRAAIASGRVISYLRSGLFEDRDDRHARLGARLRAAVHQRARCQLSAAAIEDRGRHGRRARRRADAGQAEADVPAGCAHRFHLRHGRRGAGVVGLDGGAGGIHGDPVARARGCSCWLATISENIWRWASPCRLWCRR